MISEKGLELLKKLAEVMTEADIIKNNLSEAEAAQLNGLLDKFRG
jgi:hypothetical protein